MSSVIIHTMIFEMLEPISNGCNGFSKKRGQSSRVLKMKNEKLNWLVLIVESTKLLKHT